LGARKRLIAFQQFTPPTDTPMNSIFDQTAAELKRTNDQLLVIEANVEDAENGVPQAVKEVLAESRLELYYALCEAVQKNPSIVQLYARALQRVEVIDFLLEKQSELELSPSSPLGALAVEHASEKASLEAFFTLFAPEHPNFTRYNLTGEAAELKVDSESEADTPPVPDNPDIIVQPKSELDAPVVQEAKPKRPKKSRKSSESETTTPDTKISLNGQEYIVTALEATVLGLGIRAQQSVNDDEKIKNKIVKAASIVYDESFITLLTNVKGRELDYSPRTKELREIIDSLKAKFPDTVESGGIKGGAWLKFNADAVLDVIETVEVGTVAAEETDTEPEETVPEKTVDTPSTSVPPESLPEEEIEHREKPQRPQPRKKQRRQEYQEIQKMDSRHKLLPHGYMLGRKVVNYTETERLALEVINRAERKEPYSAARIADTMQGSADEIEKSLQSLAGRLPKGWLIKVNSHPNKPAGWRLGRGVRIVRQHDTQ
jgi:hypothetical protein